MRDKSYLCQGPVVSSILTTCSKRYFRHTRWTN